jgi:hypothetical protein
VASGLVFRIVLLIFLKMVGTLFLNLLMYLSMILDWILGGDIGAPIKANTEPDRLNLANDGLTKGFLFRMDQIALRLLGAYVRIVFAVFASMLQFLPDFSSSN